MFYQFPRNHQSNFYCRQFTPYSYQPYNQFHYHQYQQQPQFQYNVFPNYSIVSEVVSYLLLIPILFLYFC